MFKLEARGYLEVHQTGQEVTSTHKPVTKCPENISVAGYKCVCLNERSIVNTKNELNIMVEDIDLLRDRIGRRGGGLFYMLKNLFRLMK